MQGIGFAIVGALNRLTRTGPFSRGSAVVVYPAFPRPYELWDAETGNIVGAAASLAELATMAYELGRANPDLEPALFVLVVGE